MFDWFIWNGSGPRRQIGRRQTPLRPLINGVCRLRALLLAPSQCLCVVNKVLLFKHIRAWQFSFSCEIESPGKITPGCWWCSHACRAIIYSRLLLVYSAGACHDGRSPSPLLKDWKKCGANAACGSQNIPHQSPGWLVQRGHTPKVRGHMHATALHWCTNASLGYSFRHSCGAQRMTGVFFSFTSKVHGHLVHEILLFQLYSSSDI